jgi:hypothetical protein
MATKRIEIPKHKLLEIEGKEQFTLLLVQEGVDITREFTTFPCAETQSVIVEQEFADAKGS